MWDKSKSHCASPFASSVCPYPSCLSNDPSPIQQQFCPKFAYHQDTQQVTQHKGLREGKTGHVLFVRPRLIVVRATFHAPTSAWSKTAKRIHSRIATDLLTCQPFECPHQGRGGHSLRVSLAACSAIRLARLRNLHRACPYR